MITAGDEEHVPREPRRPADTGATDVLASPFGDAGEQSRAVAVPSEAATHS